MGLVTDTMACSGLVGAVLGRFLVVAVPMEQLQVHQPVIPSQGLRDDVVGFHAISITEIQSTPGTFPHLAAAANNHAAYSSEDDPAVVAPSIRGCHHTGWPPPAPSCDA